MKSWVIPVCLIVATACAYALLCLNACTPLERVLVKDGGGAVCEIVVQAEDPALAPLCTTWNELWNVEEELTKAKSVTPPGGRDVLYHAILKHRGSL